VSCNLIHAFQELYAQAGCDVEGDVAMHQPSSRVIRLKRKHEIALCRKRSRITTDWVISFQTGNVTRPVTHCLVENVEVVAVQMDGVRKWWSTGILLNDPVLPLYARLSVYMYVVMFWVGGMTNLILLTDFEDVAIWCKRIVAVGYVLQRRVVEINVHGDAVDEPLNEIATTRRVGKPDFHLLGDFLWHGRLDVRYDRLVITTGGQRHGGCGVGSTRPGACISKDAADVGSISVGTIACSTGAYAKPVVACCGIGVDYHIVALTCKRACASV
jgi:hypothetical protein